MKAAHPSPAASSEAGTLQESERLASSLSPHCEVWGPWGGYLAWVPVHIYALLGYRAVICPERAQGTMDIGRALWAPAHIGTMFPGRRGCPRARVPQEPWSSWPGLLLASGPAPTLASRLSIWPAAWFSPSWRG